MPSTNDSQDITVVTGRLACGSCGHYNRSGNEYCHHCGAPLGIGEGEATQEPTTVYERRALWQVHGVETALVGRREELAALEQCFKQVVDSGEMTVVLISGQEGIGKTRLVHELAQKVHASFTDALMVSSSWREGANRAYGIIDRLLRNRFYIPDSLPDRAVRQRLREGIAALMKSGAAQEGWSVLEHYLPR